MSYAHNFRMMQSMGEHAAMLTRLIPYPGMANPANYAQLAYHYMRLAGVSPFDNNLNLNIGWEPREAA